MSTGADFQDDDIQSHDGRGDVEDGERGDDTSDAGDGEVHSHSEDENSELEGGGRPEPAVENLMGDESDGATQEFMDSEPKSPSSTSNDPMTLADDVESDEEHVDRTRNMAHKSARSPAGIGYGGVVSACVGENVSLDACVTPSSAATVARHDEIRKPIKVEYGNNLNADSEAVIRSPSLERESEIYCPSPEQESEFHGPSHGNLTSLAEKSQHFSPESAVSTMNISEPQKPVDRPDDRPRTAVSPTPSATAGPESTGNSPSVGFESLSPQSMIDDDLQNNPVGGCGSDVDGQGSKRGVAPLKLVPNQSLEDQEGELDFEEETPEERRDGTAEAVTKHRKITMTTEHTHVKIFPKVEDPEGKEEGEEGEGEDGEDDGEVEDDDDLEEGEVKESTGIRKIQPKPICRFYSKGQCTWGSACRFLHPGVNDKGNYNMFAPTKSLVPNNNVPPASSPYVWPARPPAVSPTFGTRGYVEPLPLPLPPPLPPPPPPAHFEEPLRESAWERGLRHAKEILRKSTKRKETETDFEEKRMNLGLSSTETAEYEKENDYYNRSSPYRHVTTSADPYSTTYGYEEVSLDPYERQAHDYWRGGNYENFEVHYTRSDYPYRMDRNRLKTRELDPRDVRNRERELYREPPSHDRERADRSRREKFDRVVQHTPERNWRDERYPEHQAVPNRSNRGDRGDEWCDPWRRSTSPKRRNLSRSFSSHSSMSYSSSGRSSGSRSSSYSSHSRSSSASSNTSFSSRSYSPNHAVHRNPHNEHHHPVQHAKTSNREKSSTFPTMGISSLVPEVHRRQKPLPPGLSSGHMPVQPGGTTRVSADKRPTAQTQAVAITAQPQPSGDHKRSQNPANSAANNTLNRHRSLSSSGSGSFNSRSRSRSSRSGSSRSRTSSGSSLVSVSSKSSESSKSSFNSGRNMSTLDALKREERRVRERERMRVADTPRRPPAISSGDVLDRERTCNIRDMRDSRGEESQADLRVKSLGNTPRTSKDPLRQAGQKPQIKLTLLNKAPPTDKSIAAPPPARKQAAEVRKQKPLVLAADKEPSKPVKISTLALASNSRKRPLPASPSRGGLDTVPAMAKVSSSSSSLSSRSMTATSGKAPPISAAAVALLNKKSTSSRREELLKQLKAVEDAIARKRAKFT